MIIYKLQNYGSENNKMKHHNLHIDGCGRAMFGGGTDTNDCWNAAYSCCT